METRPSYGGFDEPLDVAEKLLTEQAECAVTKAKLSEALKALRNIRGMISGRASSNTIDDYYWIASALLEEIDEQCAIILEGADERNSNLS